MNEAVDLDAWRVEEMLSKLAYILEQGKDVNIVDFLQEEGICVKCMKLRFNCCEAEL
jgi:hypothetical protein